MDKEYLAGKNAQPHDYESVWEMIGLCNNFDKLPMYYKDVYLRMMAGDWEPSDQR
jgi:hypothetical protein